MARHSATLLALFIVAGTAIAQDVCEDGWTGRNCALCSSDDGCAQKTGDPNSVCSSELAFFPNSEEKTFACTVKDSTLASLIVADSVLMQCYSGGSSNETAPVGRRLLGNRMLLEDEEAAAEGPYCDISLQLGKSLGSGIIACQATECVMEAGEMGVSCEKTACACDPVGCGNAMISGLVEQVKGAAGLDCDENGECLIQLSIPAVSSNGIKATCIASECISDL